MKNSTSTVVAILSLSLGLIACHEKETDDGRSAEQRATAAKTDEAAKKGALEEKDDPKKDLAVQTRNLKRLELNAEGSRKAGNHAAVWAIDWDIRSTKKLIAKDKQLLEASR